MKKLWLFVTDYQKKGDESAAYIVSLENYFAVDLPRYKAVDNKMQLISLAF
jgi:hypothetical protein